MFGGTQTEGISFRRGAWLIAIVVGLCALPSEGAAQGSDATLHDGGMDLHLFRPAVDTRGYFSVNGTEVMPHKEFSFGLVMDAGFGILRYNGESVLLIDYPGGSINRSCWTGTPFEADIMVR